MNLSNDFFLGGGVEGGVLARIAKIIIDDDNAFQPHETLGRAKIQQS